MNNLEECVRYFKSKTGFVRFMETLRDKYIKSGRITGFITLNDIGEEEKNDLNRFFGCSLEVGDTFSVSVVKFKKVMSNTKFGDIDPYKIVTTYFGVNEFITKRSKKKKAQNAYIDYLNDILSEVKDYELLNFLSIVLSNKNNSLSKIIKRKYNFNKKELKELILNIDKLLRNIPNTPTSIPMYASMTGNPHFLDFDTSSGTVFIKILSGIRDRKVDTLEDKLELLLEINVYNDTLSNSVITYNLKGDRLLESINNTLGPVSLNMDNICKLENLRGVMNKVFIFENPSMLNYFKGKNVSIIITSGIPNLAFYRLLDKFDKKQEFYYNGDYDPEGLVIANKLKLVYPKMNLFCYNDNDYLCTKPVVKIKLNRIHKLENVNVRELNFVKTKIEETGLVGYQESNLKNIEKFINKELEECIKI